MKPPRLSAAAVLANALALWAAIAIAAAGWWPIYQDAHFVVMVAVTTVLGSVIALLGTIFRWPSAVAVPVAIGAFVVAGVPLAVPDLAQVGLLPTVDGLRELLTGTALGWKQLLTITLPVGAYQSLLVPAYLLVLATAVVGLSIALRSRRGDLAVIPPVVLLLTGLAFGAPQPHWPLELSLGMLAVILFWLMWRRWYTRRTAMRSLDSSGTNHRVLGARTVVSALIIMATAFTIAVAAATLLPSPSERDVLRSMIEQPFDPRAYPSPLVGFRSYLKDGEDSSVIFTVSGMPANEHLRIATLDSYDGIVYSVGSAQVSSESGSFTRVPFRYDQSGVAGTPVSIDVRVGDYSGVWLPSIGQFESIAFDGSRSSSLRDEFYYNNVSGTAAVIGGLKEGDEYQLEAVLPQQPSAAELATATAGSATVPPLGAVPAELAKKLEQYTGEVDGQGAKLQAMLAGLRAEGYISHGVSPDEPASRSGHSSDRITELLTGQRMIGDSEQYAVAAALMARGLGFPARVVFGFAPGAETGGTVAVTGDMISAWIEVNTAQYGWVSLDATPPVRDIPEEQPEEPSAVSRPQSIIQPPLEEQEVTNNQSPAETTQQAPDALADWVVVLLAIARVLGWALLVAGLLASPFIVILAAKLRRRALRRRAASPIERISGGWKEFEDAVLDHGFDPPAAATRSELASAVGGAQPMAVAVIADRAIFAPTEPSAADAAELWKSVDELTAELDSGRTRWERLRARISLRSLGGYSVRSLFKRQGSIG